MDHYDKACELNSIINKKTSKDVAKNKLAEDCAKIISYYYFPSSMQKELNISSNEVAEIIINEIDNDYFSNPDGANPILSKIMQYFQ
ncbi:hypothetical protein IKS57_01645 [bacterium]|nr:hypothetical protein [bacterium]